MNEMQTIEQMQQRIASTPFTAWLGLIVEARTERGVVMRLRSRPEFLGSPSTGSLHGGITASLIDTVSSYAIMSRTGRSIATIDMRVDYHRGANAEMYRIEGSVIRLGKTTAIADSQIFDGNEVVIASGRIVVLHVDR